jgi:hypothetical protein
MFKAAGADIVGDYVAALDDKKLKATIANKFIARRADELLDLNAGFGSRGD